MAKAKTLLLIDILAFITFLVSLITGLMMWLHLGGIQKQILLPIHTYGSIIFAALIIIHFLLHYKWIKAMLRI